MRPKTRRYRSLIAAFTVAIALLLVWLAVTRQATYPTSKADAQQSGVEALPLNTPKFSPNETPIAEALSALCEEKTQQNSATSADQNSNEEREADIRQYQKHLKRIKQLLLRSPDPEHLHVTALMEEDSNVRIGILSKALDGSNNAHLIWDAVRICAESLNEATCPILDWEERMLAVDGQNSEAWIRAAANRYKAGDIDSALAAIQQAASAAESRIYWTESIEMFERGFAAGSDLSFKSRTEMAFSVATTQLPDYGAFADMCRMQSNQSIDWAYACLGYGEVAEHRGKTFIGQSIGRAIQKIALEAIGDEERLSEVMTRNDIVRRNSETNVQLADGLKGPLSLEEILVSNPTMFFDHLANIRKHGEPNALSSLYDDAREWLEDNQETGCN